MNLSALTFEEVLTLAEMGDPEAIYIYDVGLRVTSGCVNWEPCSAIENIAR